MVFCAAVDTNGCLPTHNLSPRIAAIALHESILMSTNIRILDVVALTVDVPEYGLSRGQVGTIVEMHAGEEFEVEFSGDDGRAYALVPLTARQLMVLHYQPAHAA